MITLYQYEISPFCDKVRRAMRYKGLPFRVEEIRLTKRKAYLRISPTGKFPAIGHEGRTVIDSTDILDYLETLQPSPALTPADPKQAAIARLLEDWADESLYFYDITMRSWPQNTPWFMDDLLRHEPPGLVRKLLAKILPGALRKLAKTQGLGRKSEAIVARDYAQHLDSLGALLGPEGFLCGPALSRADLSVFVMVNVISRTVEGKAAIDARPAVSAWFQTVARMTDA